MSTILNRREKLRRTFRDRSLESPGRTFALERDRASSSRATEDQLVERKRALVSSPPGRTKWISTSTRVEFDGQTDLDSTIEVVVSLLRTRQIPIPNNLRSNEFGSDQSSFSIAGDDGLTELRLVRIVFRSSFHYREFSGKLILHG